MSSTATAAREGASRLNLVIKSYDYKILNSFLRCLPVDNVGKGFVRLPTKTQRWTVNKSPFVHGKSKVTYERFTHKVLIPIHEPNHITLRWLTAIRDAGVHHNISFRVEITGGGDPATDRQGRRDHKKYNRKHSLKYRKAREKELGGIRQALIEDANQRLKECVLLDPKDSLSSRHADPALWLAELDLWKDTDVAPKPEIYRVESIVNRIKEYAPVWFATMEPILEQINKNENELVPNEIRGVLEEWVPKIDAWMAAPSRTPNWIVNIPLWRRLDQVAATLVHDSNLNSSVAVTVHAADIPELLYSFGELFCDFDKKNWKDVNYDSEPDEYDSAEEENNEDGSLNNDVEK